MNVAPENPHLEGRWLDPRLGFITLRYVTYETGLLGQCLIDRKNREIPCTQDTGFPNRKMVILLQPHEKVPTHSSHALASW